MSNTEFSDAAAYYEHALLFQLHAIIQEATRSDEKAWERIEELAGIEREGVIERLRGQASFRLEDVASVLTALGVSVRITVASSKGRQATAIESLLGLNNPSGV